MKILNLYAGIGGNRKLWDNCKVTAIEINPEIAAVYQKLYPNDTIIVTDAHDYLLEHYQKFDFIWSSPPCQSHSDVRRAAVNGGLFKAVYPAAELWQEILLLKHFAKCLWCVENVKMYYKPLVPVSFSLDRHNFWSNFEVKDKVFKRQYNISKLTSKSTVHGINLHQFKITNKRQLLRNVLNPAAGKHILDSALKSIEKHTTIFNNNGATK